MDESDLLMQTTRTLTGKLNSNGEHYMHALPLFVLVLSWFRIPQYQHIW